MLKEGHRARNTLQAASASPERTCFQCKLWDPALDLRSSELEIGAEVLQFILIGLQVILIPATV